MELFEDEKVEQGPLPEPEPRYHTEVLPLKREEHGQAWLRMLATIVIGLVLIVIIVFLARWIYHKVHHASVNAPTTSVNTPAPSSSSNGNQQSANPSSGTPSTSTPSTPQSNTQTSSTATSPTKGGSNLPNSGPGDVAAIFAGVSLAAAGLHYIINIRKFSNSQF